MKKTILSTLILILTLTGIVSAAPAPAVFQMRLVQNTASPNTEVMNLTVQNGTNTIVEYLSVDKTVLLDQTAIKSVKPGKDGLGHPMLDIKFTESGAKLFADITRHNIHKRLAIIIDGKVCQAPIIQMEIPGGAANITGNFTGQEVRDLARKINAAPGKK